MRDVLKAASGSGLRKIIRSYCKATITATKTCSYWEASAFFFFLRSMNSCTKIPKPVHR